MPEAQITAPPGFDYHTDGNKPVFLHEFALDTDRPTVLLESRTYPLWLPVRLVDAYMHAGLWSRRDDHGAVIPFTGHPEVQRVRLRCWVLTCLALGLYATVPLFRMKAQTLGEPPAPTSTPVVQTMLDAAEQAMQAGQPEEALRLAERVLAIPNPPDRVGEAQAYRLQARALQRLGHAAEALTAWRAAAQSWEQAGDTPGRVEALASAGLLLAAEQPVEAEGLVAQALALGRAEVERPLVSAKTLTEVSTVYYQRGRLEPARQLLEAGLIIYEERAPNSLDMAASLNHLGNVARQQGNLTAAKEYYWRALAIKEQWVPNSLDVAASLNNLGVVAQQQGDLTAAKEYHRRALALKEQLAPNSLDVAASLGNLGNVTRQQGDLAAAKDYYQRALAIQEQQAPGSLDVAGSLNNLGVVAKQQGDLSEAERLWQQAWTLVRQQAAGVSGDEARQAFGASTAFYAGHLLRAQVALGKSQLAFLTLEEGRAQALQQLLLERSILARAVDSPLWATYCSAVAERDHAEAAVSEASVAEARARRALAALSSPGTAPERRAPAQTALAAATRKLEAAQSTYTRTRMRVDTLWADIKKSAPRLFVPPLTLEQAHRALPEDTVFVAFAVGEAQTHVFLLRPAAAVVGSSPNLAAEPGPALSVYTVAISSKDLQKQVDLLRQEVSEPSRRMARLLITSRALVAQLFPGPARQALQGAPRLLLSPDGPLWDLPFAALVVNPVGPPHYLGVEKALTYTPSLALFDQARRDAPPRRTGRPITALVVGHPLFEHTRRSSTLGPMTAGRHTRRTPAHAGPFRERRFLFPDGRPPAPLPHTQREALAVARLYGSQPLLGQHATEAALRQRITQADVIHLATHGYFHPRRAMASGLLLTPPAQEPPPGETSDDGVLQAWEIHSQLHLRAELVVLSACDSGRGQAVRGEGIIGLTRALHYAGARAVVASQWAVADPSTGQLMVAFHRSVRQGLAKDEALRRAMRRRHQDPATSHPYYWATFFLTGDPDNAVLGGNQASSDRLYDELERGAPGDPPADASPRIVRGSERRASRKLIKNEVRSE